MENIYEIKKSKFYYFAKSVSSENDVHNELDNIKSMFKKCTHMCYAYSINKNIFLCKAVDDGEPSGTAGRPILNVIEKRKVQNVLVVVVRIFGGIKLGAGGLVRAYTKAASLALQDFEKIN